MGFSLQTQKDCAPPLAEKDKVDLAGNTFSGPVVVAVLLAIFASVDWSLVLTKMAVVEERRRKALQDDDDSDMMDMMDECEGRESEDPVDVSSDWTE